MINYDMGEMLAGTMDERLVERWGQMKSIHLQLLSPDEGLIFKEMLSSPSFL